MGVEHKRSRCGRHSGVLWLQGQASACAAPPTFIEVLILVLILVIGALEHALQGETSTALASAPCTLVAACTALRCVQVHAHEVRGCSGPGCMWCCRQATGKHACPAAGRL